MEYFLHQIVHGDVKFLNIPLDKKVTVIGEDSFPALKGYRNLSPQHAKITRKDVDKWYVEDLGSHYGTFVNCKKIASNEETVVRLGDHIGFGVRFSKRGFVCSVSANILPIKQESCDPSEIKTETENGLDEPPKKIFKSEIPGQPIKEEPPSQTFELEVPNLLTQQISADKTTKHKLSDEIINRETSRGLRPQNDYQSVQPQYAGNSIDNNNMAANYSSDDDVMVMSDVDSENLGYSHNEEVIVISDDEEQLDTTSGIEQDYKNGSKSNVIDKKTLLEILKNFDFSTFPLTSKQISENCSNETVFNASGDLPNSDCRSLLPESNSIMLDEQIKHSSPHSENAKDVDFNNDDSNSSVSSHDEILYPTCVKRKKCNVSHNGQGFFNKSDNLSEKCRQEINMGVAINMIANDKLHDAAKKKKKNYNQLQNMSKNNYAKHDKIIKTSGNDNINHQDITKKGNDKFHAVKKSVCMVAKNIKALSRKSLPLQETSNTQKVSKQKNQTKKVKLFPQKSLNCKNIVIKESPKGRNSLASYKIPKKSSSSPETNDKHSKKTPIVCKQSVSRSEFLLSDTPIKKNLLNKNISIKNAAVVTGQNQNNKLPLSSSASPAKKPTTIDKPKPSVQSLIQIQSYVSQSNDIGVKVSANITSQSQLSTHSTCVSSSKTIIKSSCTISPPVKNENLAKDNVKFPEKLANSDNSQSRHMQLPISNTSVHATNSCDKNGPSHYTFDCSMSYYVEDQNIATTSSAPTAEVYKRQRSHKQLEATKKPLSIDYNRKSVNGTSNSSTKTEQHQKQLVSNVSKSLQIEQHRSSIEDKSPKLETATVKPYVRDYHHTSSMDNRTFNNSMTSELQHAQLETTIKKPLIRNYQNPHCVDDISVGDSLTAVPMEFHQQQTKIPAVNPISAESLIQRIVEFNYQWLKEQQVMSSPPPPVSKGVRKLPYHFSSFNEYFFFFLPMLMLEVWETLHEASKILWVEPQMRANAFQFKIESCESTEPMTRFRCGALIETNSFNPMTGNVILMHIKDLAMRQRHTILGYIDCHGIQECPSNPNEKRVTTAKLWPFSVLVKARNFQPKCNVIFEANGICSVTKYLDLLDALNRLDTSSLRENVLMPNFNACSISYSSREPLSDRHNKSVIECISKVIEDSTSSPKVVLLQGSYGAVKTGIIVSLLENLIHIKGSNFKVLVTASSNDAIEEIGRALIQLNEHRYEQSVKFVLINYPNEVSEELRTFTVDNFYNEQLQIKADLNNIKIELNDLYCQKRSTFVAERIQRLKDRSCNMRQKLFLRNNTGAMHMSDILRKYSIVLAPLNRCYQSDLISRSQYRKDKNMFSCCIVDEATQCTELELLQAVSDTRKLILVGDPQQSAIVLSMTALQNGYGRSMFGRFQEFKLAREQ